VQITTVAWAVPAGADDTPAKAGSERALLALLVLNILLQVFDGLATYLGLHAGFPEGNPIVAWGIEHLGPAAALALFKLEACACLVVLWWLGSRSTVAVPALAAAAAIYAIASVLPWSTALSGTTFAF
jgi:hypothetical protein